MMKNQIHGTSRVHFALLLLFFGSSRVQCRQWQSIVNHDIIRKSNIDSRRYELEIEFDPFFYPGDKSPTEIPTETPQAPTPQASKVWTTVSPTMSPSVVPTDGPSMQPTEFDIERNGGCRNGLKLYEVHMMDKWGDGWEGTSITITGISDLDSLAADLPTNSMTTTNTNAVGDTVVSITKTIEFDTYNSNPANFDSSKQIDPLGKIFEGTLTEGYHDFSDVCLVPNRCYRLVATGGEFLEEVSWELRPGSLDPDSPLLSMEPILSGIAPTGCTFSLPDEYGHHFCENTCSESILADATTKSPDVMDNLQPIQTSVASEALTEAVGRTSIVPAGSLGGKSAAVTPVTQAMISNARTGSSSASAADVLKHFSFAGLDEHSRK
mmetsp:Transcript_27665/g.60925  ORF Transcript_27665/g.60925 Transcript_27665/m.60925 type:complete len:380 (-) Transcript_27665:2049-3188(-)